ncbi:MAG: hypothetical protein JXL97_15375 [Bacteroidales bacterium]|nr:hypothetical protein [Bacteroidales bacterium]
MKKLFSLFIVFVVLLTFSSCKQSPEEMLLGTWQNTNTEISKLDAISQLLYDYQVTNLNEQLQTYKDQLELLDESQKSAYEQIISNLEKQLTDLSIDSIKGTITSNLKKQSITFKEDSTLILKSEIDSVTGTWNLTEDAKKLNILIETDVMTFDINELSKEKLIFVMNNDIDTINFDVTYSFEK